MKKGEKTKGGKKKDEPKVLDLTGNPDVELREKKLDGVSGGRIMQCGTHRASSCNTLVIIVRHRDKQLTILT